MKKKQQDKKQVDQKINQLGLMAKLGKPKNEKKNFGAYLLKKAKG